MNQYTSADYLPELFAYAYLYLHEESMNSNSIPYPASTISRYYSLRTIYQDLCTFLMLSTKDKQMFLAECHIEGNSTEEMIENLFRTTFETAIDERTTREQVMLRDEDLDLIKTGIRVGSPYQIITKITGLLFIFKFLMINKIPIAKLSDHYAETLPFIYNVGGIKSFFKDIYDILAIDDRYIIEVQKYLGLEGLTLNEFFLSVSMMTYHLADWYTSIHEPISNLRSNNDLALENSIDSIYFE